MTKDYDDFLSRKVEAARASMRAGLGRTNDAVEGKFAARRAGTLRQVLALVHKALQWPPVRR